MDISVIIPTFNRRETLRRVLLLYNRQKGMSRRFEMIVVDDASGDGTPGMLRQLQPELAYPLRYLVQSENAGAAAARNRAIEAANGRVLFITGDDILPDEHLLLEHWTWHAERYPAAHVGVLGLVRWAEELRPTPFMRWLEESGTQFAVGSLRHGSAVGYGHLYTSNVSIKREFLVSVGEYLDERLRFCEDSEWGERLSRKGFELRANVHALGNHLHETTLSSSLNRMAALGRAVAVLREVNPAEFARVTNKYFEPRNRLKLMLLRAALHPALLRLAYLPLARLCEQRLIVDRVYAACHAACFLEILTAAGTGVPARRYSRQIPTTA